MRPKLKHIFFDLDHTLWDFDKNSTLTFQKIFNQNNITIPIAEFKKVYEPINFQYWKLYREEQIDKSSLRFGRLNDSFKALNYLIDPQLIHTISNQYIQYLTTFNHLFEDAANILNYLRPKYQLHIITNGFQEVQHKKIEAAQIAHYFKTVTNSEMAGVKKPNPKIFDYALAKAHANPQESMMIGDNYEADILGGLNAGLDVIFFNIHNHNAQIKVKEVKALSQLKEYL